MFLAGGTQIHVALGQQPHRLHAIAADMLLRAARTALATLRLDGRAMSRALMARLVGREHTDYAGPAELAERASLRPPVFRLVGLSVPARGNSVTDLDTVSVLM